MSTSIDSTKLTIPNGIVSTYQTTAYNSMKNRIINGGMNIDERNRSFVDVYYRTNFGIQLGQSANSYYSSGSGGMYYGRATLDRWGVTTSGLFGVQIARCNVASLWPTVSSGYAQGFADYSNAMQVYFGGTGGSTQGQGAQASLYQKIESIYTEDLVGSDITISCKMAHANSTWSNVSWEIWSPNVKDTYTVVGGSGLIPPGPGGEYTNSYVFYNSCTLVAKGYWSVDNVMSYKTATLNLGSYGSKGLVLAIRPYIQTGATFPYYGIAAGGFANSYFYMTNVQLEKGSSASPFDFRPIGKELDLCQRYCIAFGKGTNYFAPPMKWTTDGRYAYIYMGTSYWFESSIGQLYLHKPLRQLSAGPVGESNGGYPFVRTLTFANNSGGLFGVDQSSYRIQYSFSAQTDLNSSTSYAGYYSGFVSSYYDSNSYWRVERPGSAVTANTIATGSYYSYSDSPKPASVWSAFGGQNDVIRMTPNLSGITTIRFIDPAVTNYPLGNTQYSNFNLWGQRYNNYISPTTYPYVNNIINNLYLEAEL